MLHADGWWVLALLTAMSGMGLFLRVVAKEKHRREKHLQARLEAKLKRAEDEERSREQQSARPARRPFPLTAKATPA